MYFHIFYKRYSLKLIKCSRGKTCISRIDKMGDMILTLPVVKSIKIQNPKLEIHVLASA